MLFNSWQYALFLPIVTAGYFLCTHKYRWILLLCASYYFYMSWNPKLVFLILFTTATSYFAALKVEKSTSIKQKRLWLWGGIIVSLACLFYFKYFNFFSHSVTALLRRFSLPVDDFTVQVLLPVGISFYTFQTLSYIIDVYRGELAAQRHFGIYALYVSFFPQLVAGPIERAVTLLPQFKEKHNFSVANASYGCHQIAWGLFKKVVVADTAAIYVEKVYGNLQGCGPMAYVIGTILFAFQIYCDFSGYSDIALGSARILGFRLMENFDCPYFSTNIREFWRRWHISLSTWFKDYVYIPLGGSRCSKAKHLRNLFITFFISGLWHGASWNFVLWGALFGLLNIVDVFLLPMRNKYMENKKGIVHYTLQTIHWAVCFGLVCLCWIFFRAETLSDTIFILSRIPWALSSPIQGISVALQTIGLTGINLIALCAALTLLIVHDYFRYRWGDAIAALQKSPCLLKWGVRFIVCTAVVLAALTIPEGVAVEFIYFQF